MSSLHLPTYVFPQELMSHAESSGGAAAITPTSATTPTPKVNGFNAAAETLCAAFEAYSQGLLFRDLSDDIELPEERMLIACWVDYCNKYGMGYALTDRSVGVNFNDSNGRPRRRQAVRSLSHLRRVD